MICPICGKNKTITIDSRKKENYVHRRRECSRCGTRFSTSEYSNQHIKELQEDYRRLEESLEELQAWKRLVEKRTYGYTLCEIPDRSLLSYKAKRPRGRRKVKRDVPQGVRDGGARE